MRQSVVLLSILIPILKNAQVATKINRYYNNFKLYTREGGSRVEYKNTFITSVSNIYI